MQKILRCRPSLKSEKLLKVVLIFMYDARVALQKCAPAPPLEVYTSTVRTMSAA